MKRPQKIKKYNENICSTDPPPVRNNHGQIWILIDTNWFDYSLPEEEDVTYSYVSRDKTVKYQWKSKYELVGCWVRENIIYNKPGPNTNQQCPIEMFDIFFTNQIFEDITRYTNSKIRMFCDKI